MDGAAEEMMTTSTVPPTLPDITGGDFWENLATTGTAVLVEGGLRLAKAVIVYIVGKIIIAIIMWAIGKALKRNKKMSEMARGYVCSLIRFFLSAMLWIAILDTLGLDMTSLSAILAALAFAIGMAIGGLADNFIGGLLLMINKPIKEGDFIETSGVSGIVVMITPFVTHLRSPDNKLIYVPNGGLVTGTLVNYSTQPTRRIDLVIGIGYDDDIAIARRTIRSIIDKDECVFDDPKCEIRVHSLGDNSVNFVVRPWVNNEDYWSTYWRLMEAIKVGLDKKGVGIPYPQRDIHIINDDNKKPTMDELDWSDDEKVTKKTPNETVKAGPMAMSLKKLYKVGKVAAGGVTNIVKKKGKKTDEEGTAMV